MLKRHAQEPQDPTTVFFVSFNLKSQPAIDLGKALEKKFSCIVFAEETGTQNAAKLGSAKFNQTLQHPYTEKNFVMAVQTIVKNRKAQWEKDERKRIHDEKMRARVKLAEGPKSDGVFLQEAPEQMIDDSSRVFKGEKPLDFFVVQESESPVPRGRFDVQPHAPTRTFEEITLSLERGGEERSLTRTTSSFSQKSSEEATEANRDSEIRSRQTRNQETPMSHFWAVLGMCLIGSAICLYCVYQVLFVI